MSNLSSLFKMLTVSPVVLGLAAFAGPAMAAPPGSSFNVVQSPAPGDDPMYSFVYTDLNGDSAWGRLTVDGNGNATGGFIDVTEGLAAGNYNLLAATAFVSSPGPTNYVTSPDGAFYYDDVVYATNQIPNTPSLDMYGLLFVGTGANNLPTEINLWGNYGANDYSFWAYSPNAGYYVANGNPGNGTFALAVAPEGSSLMLLLPGLLPAALVARRRFRKR
jgi:hypothetical protein